MPHPDEALAGLVSTAPLATITVGASPYTFVAPTRGVLVVQGGVVSLLELGRNVFTSTGVVAGPTTLSKGDRLRITYTVAPAVNWFPG